MSTHSRGFPESPGSSSGPMPERIVPMRPSPVVVPPDGPGWALELKWGGVRAIAFCEPGSLRLQGARGDDLTALFPEIEGLAEAEGAGGTVLDGELVALTEKGIPDLSAITRRVRPRPEAPGASVARGLLATYVIYDLLWADGVDTRPLSYHRRRELLAARGLGDLSWRVPDYVIGQPAATLRATAEHGLEGLVMKRLESPYVGSSAPSPCWLTIGNPRRQDFIVGGWKLEQKPCGPDEAGLLLGYWDYARALGQHLRFAGTARTPTGSVELESLASDLKYLETDASPFVDLPADEPVDGFAKPINVVQVSFQGWDEEGRLREAAFSGPSPYRYPGEVRREPWN